MFNSDFFPTPPEVIQLMINEDLTGKVVLEPSAGKGDLVDGLKLFGAERVLTCELNPDLAKIVQSKSQFLKSDFLDVKREEISHIHAIYMNPPFSADEKHIVHAWEIAPSGCHIVALCNFQTLDNDYTYGRKRLLSIIREYGNSVNLGDVFSTAERRTNVEIGLINLFKPKTDSDFSEYFDSEEDEHEEQYIGLMPYNAVREVVQRYVHACQLYDDVLDNAVKMNHLVGVLGVKDISFACSEDGKSTEKEAFQKELQKKAWKWIFKKLNMGKYMTQKVKEEINKFVEQQTNIPFTMKNIYKMFDIIIATHGQMMSKALVEVFDRLTTHYHENRYCVEGWKTNSHYLVNKKFILNGVSRVSWGGELDVEWDGYNVNLLDDLYKALCYITGKPFENGMDIYSFYRKREDITEEGEKISIPPKEFGKWYDWGFFEIKAYKKGTVHCKFKSEDVWAKFNQAVAEAKGFPLPESIKRAA